VKREVVFIVKLRVIQKNLIFIHFLWNDLFVASHAKVGHIGKKLVFEDEYFFVSRIREMNF